MNKDFPGIVLSTFSRLTIKAIPSISSDKITVSAKPIIGGASIKTISKFFCFSYFSYKFLHFSELSNLVESGGIVPEVITLKFLIPFTS